MDNLPNFVCQKFSYPLYTVITNPNFVCQNFIQTFSIPIVKSLCIQIIFPIMQPNQVSMNTKVAQLFRNHPIVDTGYLETNDLQIDPFLDSCEEIQLLLDQANDENYQSTVDKIQKFIAIGPMYKQIYKEILEYTLTINTKRRKILKRIKDVTLPGSLLLRFDVYSRYHIPPLSLIKTDELQGESKELWIYIYCDNLQKLQELVLKHAAAFDFEQLFTFRKCRWSKVNLLDIAAYFGSIQCFKYLYLNNVKLTKYTPLLAICGGNIEVVQLVNQISEEQDVYKNELSIIVSIVFHQNQITYWLLNKYPYNHLCVPIQAFNYHIFKKFFYET